MAVSYTHLDVYKRQTVESEPDSGTIFTITIPYNLTEVSDDEFINGE